MSDADWSGQRGDAAMAKAAALRRKQVEESDQALALIRQFVADAKAAGLPPTRLSVLSYDGQARYRSNITGWYLKRDRSIGVGDDGHFYLLSAPTNVGSWLTGVKLSPSEPPLEVGRGGRDGESMPLADALAKRLAGGATWGA